MVAEKKTTKKPKTKKKNRWNEADFLTFPKKIRTPYDKKRANFNSIETKTMIDDHFGTDLNLNLQRKVKDFGYKKRVEVLSFEDYIDADGLSKKRIVKKTDYIYTPSKDFIANVPDAQYVKKRNMYQKNTGVVFAGHLLEKIKRTKRNLQLMKMKDPKGRRIVSKADVDIALDPNFDISTFGTSEKIKVKSNSRGGAAAAAGSVVVANNSSFDYIESPVLTWYGQKYILPVPMTLKRGGTTRKKSKKKKKKRTQTTRKK